MTLEFTSDLVFTVDGADGSRATGRVEGDGRVLRVVTTDAAVVWGAALGSSTTGPRVLDAVARRLADEGAVLEVTGPDGVVATVGAGVDSPVGRLLAGSRHVRLGRPRAVAPLARARAAQLAGQPRGRAALAAAALAALLAVRRLLRPTRAS